MGRLTMLREQLIMPPTQVYPGIVGLARQAVAWDLVEEAEQMSAARTAESDHEHARDVGELGA